MNSLPRHTLALLCLPLLASGGAPTAPLETAAAKNPKQPEEAVVLPAETGGWTLGAGPQWRQIGEASFRGGGRAGPSHLPAPPKGGGGIRGGYSDGYVRPDATGSGQTWNWGYNSASQINGNNLTLSGSSSEIVTRTLARGYNTDWSDDLSNAGFYLLLESPELVKWEHFSLSAALGYSFAQDEVGRRAVAFRAERFTTLRTRNVTDVYDISAIAPAPAAPYQGTFNGPGPVISLTPASSSGGGGTRERLLGSEVFTSYLEQSLELQLHTLSLGPRTSMEFGSLRLLAGLGLAVNIVPWEAESRETLKNSRGRTLKTWTASESGTDVLAGLYAELGAEWRFTKRWSLNTGVRYDWSQPLEGEVSGTEFDVDLGGWTAMLGLGWRF